MVPFAPPRIDQKIIDEVVDTLKSGWITTGPKTKKFEKMITAYCGNKSTICLGSATEGLELVLRWFGVQPGDEVIVPAYTYCATANVVVHCGAKPVMVDINPHDFNMSVSAVRAAITERTKVIMPVDFAGLPCDYDQLNALVLEAGIKAMFSPKTENQELLGRILILSDSAHSIGGEYKGRKTGSLTDISVFSFHAVKNLITAEGGAVALNLPAPFDNDELYKHLNISSLHGQSKDALAKTQIGNWRYDVITAGYKANMPDILASIGLVELERYEDDTLAKRKVVFEQYAKAFAAYDWAELPPYQTNEKVSSCHVFGLRIKGVNEAKRDAIMQLIFEQQVSVNVHFQPLPMLTFYKGLGYNIDDYPVSYANYERVITLPVFYDITDGQIAQVVNAVAGAVEKVMG